MKLITNELIPVYETDKGEKIVDARELHNFLKVGRDFPHWIKDRIEKYEFVEGEEFSSFLTKTSEGGRPRVDYIFKLDTAKEIAMVENNEQGRKARKYFIEVEAKFKNQSLALSELSPQLQLMIEMEQRQNKLEQGLNQLQLVVDNEVWLTENQKCDIQELVNSRVAELRKKGYSAHYQSIYRTLKSHFSVPKYDKIARKDYENAVELICGWYPRKKVAN